MKPIYSITLFCLTLSFNACMENERRSDGLIPEIPREKNIISSNKSRENMVDHIYYNCVDTIPKLKAIENKMREVADKQSEWYKTYHQYISYAETYIEDANTKINAHGFEDSLAKIEANALLSAFITRHVERMQLIDNKMKQMKRLEEIMQDKYLLLKLHVSMPIINSYLDNNLPNDEAIDQVIEAYENTIKQMEKEMAK